MCVGIFYGILFGYFIFGFTTDPDSCWASDDSKVRIEPEKKHDGATDVGQQFMFAWKIMFVCACILFPVGCIKHFFSHISNESWMLLDTVATCSGCSIMITWILALFYRYAHTG